MMESENRFLDFETARKNILDILSCQVTTVTAIKIVGALMDATADAEPIRHGKWIRKFIPSRGRGKSTHKLVYVCDQCGRREPQPEPYCHCGAKMEVKTDEY